MTYREATRAWKRVGASKAESEGYLAMVCSVMALSHPAMNAERVYDGAKKRGLDGNQVRRMAPADIADLMFVE
jgi:hypothetical protein